MAKTQRDEERVTARDVDKIHQLYRQYHVEVSLIAERFGLEEIAVREILLRPHVPRGKKWRVRWDDDEGARREEFFETFRACRMFHSKLKASWSKIEPV